MKNRYSFIFLGAMLAVIAPSFAQNDRDALRLSREEITGSARTVAMGGAFTALGGDISALSQNPGGIAVFRTNEFSISPSYHTQLSNSNYYGQSVLNSRSNFNLATFGIIGVKDLKQTGKWRSSSIGFGMNRTYNFNKSYAAKGQDVPSSLIDDYEQILYNNDILPDDWQYYTNPPFEFDIYLAWNNYLLDYDTIDNLGYMNATGVKPVDQNISIQTSGSKRESFLAFGGNYDDKLYIGGSFILSRIQYARSYQHNEVIDKADTTTALTEFTYRFDEEISGYGIAANAGVIYRPITPVRLGFSVKTPTIYSLNIQYDSENTAVFDFGIYESQSPRVGKYDFKLSSPIQSTFGIAYIFQKYGLVSADVEYVDYSMMKMQGISDGYNFSTEENAIKSNLQQAINLRFGAEYRLNQFLSLRGGYAKYGNPYKSSLGLKGGFDLYSIGLGYRNEDFYVDGAYQYKASSAKEYFYDPQLVEYASTDFSDHRITLTFGYRF